MVEELIAVVYDMGRDMLAAQPNALVSGGQQSKTPATAIDSHEQRPARLTPRSPHPGKPEIAPGIQDG